MGDEEHFSLLTIEQNYYDHLVSSVQTDFMSLSIVLPCRCGLYELKSQALSRSEIFGSHSPSSLSSVRRKDQIFLVKCWDIRFTFKTTKEEKSISFLQSLSLYFSSAAFWHLSIIFKLCFLRIRSPTPCFFSIVSREKNDYHPLSTVILHGSLLIISTLKCLFYKTRETQQL